MSFELFLDKMFPITALTELPNGNLLLQGVEISGQRKRVKLLLHGKCANPDCNRESTFFKITRDHRNPNRPWLSFFWQESDSHKSYMTVDHIVPKSKGGTNNLENLQPACFKCNHKKADNESWKQ